MNELKINPTKVLVEDIIEAEEQTKGGILLPTQILKAKTMKGKIILIGEGTQYVKIMHKVGDIALFNPSAGTKLIWNDKEYRLVDTSEVLLSGI